MQATIVFEKIWNAIHAVNTDGSRKYKYIINTGSSRSSKTFSILQAHWVMCLKNPNTRVSIWRETKADCKMTILADLKKAVPSFPNIENVIFNKTESIYTFLNGSTIEFMGGDEENRVHGFQGDIAHLNEPYKFGLEAFNQIDMRTSGFIIIDWNPKNKHWIDEVSKRDNAIVIHSTYKDNPFVPEEQKKKILSYDPSNPYNVEQGTADAYLHAVYALGLKAEKPNRIFKGWEAIEPSMFDKIPYQSYYATDFGLSAPTANLEFKFDGDKSFFFRERLYKPMNQMKGTLVEELDNLKTDKTKENICDSGNEINQSESRKLKNAGHNVVPAKKGAGSISAGIETMQKCKIYYTKDSVNLEHEYENYSWRMYQGIQMDEPEQNNEDHLLDCARMGVSWYVRTRRLSI
jgi:PBSX family phage terminase large subunit